jgi:anti-sigma factor RsiW
VATRHPETELVPYLRGELAAADARRMAAHLAGCPACRESLEASRELLSRLRETVPAPPPVQWARYRAELATKLEHHRQRRGAGAWWRPVPLTASAVLAGILVLLAFVPGAPRRTRGPDLSSLEEAAVGARLDIIQHAALLERLDMLEDFDLLRQLDALGEG